MTEHTRMSFPILDGWITTVRFQGDLYVSLRCLYSFLRTRKLSYEADIDSILGTSLGNRLMLETCRKKTGTYYIPFRLIDIWLVGFISADKIRNKYLREHVQGRQAETLKIIAELTKKQGRGDENPHAEDNSGTGPMDCCQDP